MVVQKIYLKMYPVLCTNTYHDVTDLVNHGMVKNTKTWISWRQKIIFLRNKKILNLCLRWHILRSYRFLVEVTFIRSGSSNLCQHHQPSKGLTLTWVRVAYLSLLQCLCLLKSQVFLLQAGLMTRFLIFH